jgi:exodeoxyribonuclease V beta subunit
LRLRLADYDYDRHVGGVFYVFLRGVDPAAPPGHGVFHDRPSRALVEALDRHMEGAT